MTNVKNKKATLTLLINGGNQQEDKNKMILALIAPFRWYVDCLNEGIYDVRDSIDLHTIAQLLELVCKTKITSDTTTEGRFRIDLGVNTDDEDIERMHYALVGATRWYGSVDSGKYNCATAENPDENPDGTNLLMLTRLHKSLIEFSSRL